MISQIRDENKSCAVIFKRIVLFIRFLAVRGLALMKLLYNIKIVNIIQLHRYKKFIYFFINLCYKLLNVYKTNW